MQKKLTQIWDFCSSMKCGILLMLLLALGSVLGSLVEQGNSLDWYLQRYSERTAALIYGLSLDDVFHSGWFLALAILLCCNLTLCSLLSLPKRLRRWKDAADPEKLPQPDVSAAGLPDPAPIFTRLRMPKPAESEREGRRLLCSTRHRIGLWGAWVSHLGVLLLIVGFILSQARTVEFTVYGVPGQTRPVGETRYQLTIDDFTIDRSENGSVEQYTTRVTMRDTVTGETERGAAGVNSPANLFGYRVYQNSTGAAAKVTVRMDGKVQQEEYVCVGDGISILNTPLQLWFEAYDAQYSDAGGGAALPGYVYTTTYMGQADQTGVQVEGEVALRYGEVEIFFSDPQDYTLLQLKHDPFVWLAALGGAITLLGMLMAFYLQPRRVWALEGEDGWTVCGASRKGKVLFVEQFREAAGLLDGQEAEGR